MFPGNKGGVGIRLVVRNTSMAFVCSHFAAGQKEVNERNQDYDSIVKKMIFNMVGADSDYGWAVFFGFRFKRKKSSF